jgi:RimJ/RimL family protein N-acetyltransferase
MVEIRTERLLLRPASASDVMAFHRILSDETATAFWSTPPHKDVAQTEAWVAGMMSIDPLEGEDFVVECEGRVIGKAGLYRFPEIGYILHPDAWGQGYAQEALGPVLARALSLHRLPFVDADVDPRNAASLRLLQRLGFEEVGRANRTWNVGGEWCDSVYLRLERARLAADDHLCR